MLMIEKVEFAGKTLSIFENKVMFKNIKYIYKNSKADSASFEQGPGT